MNDPLRGTIILHAAFDSSVSDSEPDPVALGVALLAKFEDHELASVVLTSGTTRAGRTVIASPSRATASRPTAHRVRRDRIRRP